MEESREILFSIQFMIQTWGFSNPRPRGSCGGLSLYNLWPRSPFCNPGRTRREVILVSNFPPIETTPPPLLVALPFFGGGRLLAGWGEETSLVEVGVGEGRVL